jgi:hypothetical protein
MVKWDAAVESEGEGEANDFRVFARGRKTAEFIVFIGAIRGPILRHHIEIGVTRNAVGEEPQAGIGAGDVAGKNEMANEESPECDAVVIGDEVVHLAVHLADDGAGNPNIRARRRILFREPVIPVLDIGHIDVHDAVQQAEDRDGIVGARIVNDGQAKAAGDGDRERLQNLRDAVAGGNQVQVVASEALDFKEDIGERVRRGRRADPLLADVVVLAIDAVEVASREEDGAGAARAYENRLLAEMGTVRRHERESRDAAIARLVGEAVNLTRDRTRDARGEKVVRLDYALREAAGLSQPDVCWKRPFHPSSL